MKVFKVTLKASPSYNHYDSVLFVFTDACTASVKLKSAYGFGDRVAVSHYRALYLSKVIALLSQ